VHPARPADLCEGVQPQGASGSGRGGFQRQDLWINLGSPLFNASQHV